MTHQYMEIKIKELENRIEALEQQGQTETVTEFADRCRECGTRYVSREAFKQVLRERDIAIEQLKELGYGFGQKIEQGKV